MQGEGLLNTVQYTLQIISQMDYQALEQLWSQMPFSVWLTWHKETKDCAMHKPRTPQEIGSFSKNMSSLNPSSQDFAIKSCAENLLYSVKVRHMLQLSIRSNNHSPYSTSEILFTSFQTYCTDAHTHKHNHPHTCQSCCYVSPELCSDKTKSTVVATVYNTLPH